MYIEIKYHAVASSNLEYSVPFLIRAYPHPTGPVPIAVPEYGIRAGALVHLKL